MELLLQLGIPILLLAIGWTAGRAAERRHFSSLDRRESALAHILISDIKTFPGGCDFTNTPTVVIGEAVIANDYLKSFLAGLRKILGGELGVYRSLMMRARREAILRAIEQAHAKGFDAICNLRLESSDIGGGAMGKGATMVECTASATAYKRAEAA